MHKFSSQGLVVLGNILLVIYAAFSKKNWIP